MEHGQRELARQAVGNGGTARPFCTGIFFGEGPDRFEAGALIVLATAFESGRMTPSWKDRAGATAERARRQ